MQTFLEFLMIREGLLPYGMKEKSTEFLSWRFKTRTGEEYEATAASLPLHNGGEIAKIDYHSLDSRGYPDIGYSLHHRDWTSVADVLDTVAKIVKDVERKSKPAGFLFHSVEPVRAKLVERWVDQEFPNWKKHKERNAVYIFRTEEDLMDYLSNGIVSNPLPPQPRRPPRANVFALN